jgi:hypothetical protein
VVIAEAENKNDQWTPGYFETEEDQDKKPTLDDILALHRDGSQYFAAFHKQCQEEEDYYRGRKVVPTPEGIDSVWPSTATGIVNIATDHVDVNNLAIDVPSSPRNRARAERIMKFLQGVWMAQKKPELRTATKQAFLYGIAFLKTMFDSDRWPKAPYLDQFEDEAAYKEALKDFMELRKVCFPIVVKPIRAKNLIWDDSRTKMKWCIESYATTVQDLKWRYPEWAEGKELTKTAQWMEYWDEEWVAFIIDNEFVYGPHKHGYGFIPYTGIFPVNSYTFEDDLPENRYWGILRPAHNLLDEDARLLTQISAIVRTMSWRTLDFAGPENQARKTAEDYELFGGKNIVYPGVDVRLSPLANIPGDLYQQRNDILNAIEMITFPNVLRGLRPKGVGAGYPMSILAGMGRLVFQGVADGLRHAVEDVNSNILRLIENKIMGSLTVHARRDVHNFDQAIGPNDIRGLYENSVQIKAEAPEEREREALLAMRLYQGLPGFSMYEALRRAGITNPLEEMVQRKAEDLMNSPDIIQMQAQMLLQDLNLPGQQMQAVGIDTGGVNPGSMNLGGAQLPRPGEGMIQQARIASGEGRPSVFAQNMGEMGQLGKQLGTPTGGAVPMPSGQVVS